MKDEEVDTETGRQGDAVKFSSTHFLLRVSVSPCLRVRSHPSSFILHP
jgi:hypothetical protein